MKKTKTPFGWMLAHSVVAMLAITLTSGAAKADLFLFYGPHPNGEPPHLVGNVHTDDALVDALSPGFYVSGALDVGIEEEYFDAGGTGRSVTATGWDPFTTATQTSQLIWENTRARADLGLGVGTTGDDTSQPLELGVTEVIRIELGTAPANTTRSNFVVYFSSIDGSEKMQVAISDDAVPAGGIPWADVYDDFYNSVGDDDDVALADGVGVPVDLSALFGGDSSDDLTGYLFFREDPDTGYSNDDVLLTQLSYLITEDPFGGPCAVGQCPIPEPGTIWLFGFGLAGLAFIRRRRRIV